MAEQPGVTDLSLVGSPSALSPDQLLTTTRSVRRRLDFTRPVPLVEIRNCIRIAAQAPCGDGRYTSHWIIVTDRRGKAAIGRLYRSACERYLAAIDRGSVGTAWRRSEASMRHLAAHLDEVPMLVLACLDTGGPLPAGNQVSLWGTMLPAVWSYMLAARSRGLGTVWTTQHLRHEQEIATLLGIPPGVHQAVLVPTAYYRGTTFRPAARSPLAPTIHMDRW